MELVLGSSLINKINQETGELLDALLVILERYYGSKEKSKHFERQVTKIVFQIFFNLKKKILKKEDFNKLKYSFHYVCSSTLNGFKYNNLDDRRIIRIVGFMDRFKSDLIQVLSGTSTVEDDQIPSSSFHSSSSSTSSSPSSSPSPSPPPPSSTTTNPNLSVPITITTSTSPTSTPPSTPSSSGQISTSGLQDLTTNSSPTVGASTTPTSSLSHSSSPNLGASASPSHPSLSPSMSPFAALAHPHPHPHGQSPHLYSHPHPHPHSRPGLSVSSNGVLSCSGSEIPSTVPQASPSSSTGSSNTPPVSATTSTSTSTASNSTPSSSSSSPSSSPLSSSFTSTAFGIPFMYSKSPARTSSFKEKPTHLLNSSPPSSSSSSPSSSSSGSPKRQNSQKSLSDLSLAENHNSLPNKAIQTSTSNCSIATNVNLNSSNSGIGNSKDSAQSKLTERICDIVGMIANVEFITFASKQPEFKSIVYALHYYLKNKQKS